MQMGLWETKQTGKIPDRFQSQNVPKGRTTAEQYLVYHFPLGWKMTPFEGGAVGGDILYLKAETVREVPRAKAAKEWGPLA